MENGEKTAVEAVQRMQDYIVSRTGEADLEKLCREIGYSRRHAERLFKQLVGRTLTEYALHIRVTAGAGALRQKDVRILDVALKQGFDSHEGFLRAFRRELGVTPQTFRKGKTPVPLFVYYPIRATYAHLFKKGECNMEEIQIVTATLMSRPDRKLLLLRSRNAREYFSFCEEMGCAWEGLLNSIPQKLDQCALLELTPQLIREGTSPVAAGVELPVDYDGEVPEGYELLDLPACAMLHFQTEPFEREEDYVAAIEAAFHAKESYDAARYGLAFAPECGPVFNFGAASDTGARLAFPVRRCTCGD